MTCMLHCNYRLTSHLEDCKVKDKYYYLKFLMILKTVFIHSALLCCFVVLVADDLLKNASGP